MYQFRTLIVIMFALIPLTDCSYSVLLYSDAFCLSDKVAVVVMQNIIES